MRPRELDADNQFAAGFSWGNVDNAALGRKFRIGFVRRWGDGNPDVQSASEVECIARGESGPSTAKIFTRSTFLEHLPPAVSATNQHGKMDRDSSFPAALEGGARRAGSGHETPPTLTVSAKNESTRSRISAGVRAVCTFPRNSLPFGTPCVK